VRKKRSEKNWPICTEGKTVQGGSGKLQKKFNGANKIKCWLFVSGDTEDFGYYRDFEDAYSLILKK